VAASVSGTGSRQVCIDGQQDTAIARSAPEDLLIRLPGDHVGPASGMGTAAGTSSTGQRHLDRCLLHVEGIPLATFNTKDYADFADYDGLDLFDVS